MSIPNQTAPHIPAAQNALTNLAAIYHQQDQLDEAFEVALGKCTKLPGDDTRDGARACWLATMHRSATVMAQAPQSAGDMLITLGVAAGYAGILIDNTEGSDQVIAKGVCSALDNAVKFLVSQGVPTGLPVEAAGLVVSICRNFGITAPCSASMEEAA